MQKHSSIPFASFTPFTWVVFRREVSADNIITVVWSWRCLKYPFFFFCLFCGGRETAFDKFQSIFLSASNRLLFALKHTDGCVHRPASVRVRSSDSVSGYQVQTANAAAYSREIDWGDRSKQVLSADELSGKKITKVKGKDEIELINGIDFFVFCSKRLYSVIYIFFFLW